MTFQQAVSWLWSELEFAAWEQTRFRFRGREFQQDHNKRSIKFTMSTLVSELEPVTVSKKTREKLGEPLEPKLHTCFRGGVGQLQWLQLRGNPSFLAQWIFF